MNGYTVLRLFLSLWCLYNSKFKSIYYSTEIVIYKLRLILLRNKHMASSPFFKSLSAFFSSRKERMHTLNICYQFEKQMCENNMFSVWILSFEHLTEKKNHFHHFISSKRDFFNNNM